MDKPTPLTKTIKVPSGMLSRAAKVERGEDGKIEWVSIASDRPYKRYDWWNDEEYYEVLSHKPEGIDTERLESGLPVCFNHNTNQQLATAGNYKIEDGKLSLKFSEFKWTKGEFTDNKRADMESGALPHTSVSYELVGDGVCTGAKDGIPVYEFRWKPYEGGPVVIPADASVGPGRSREKALDEKPREILVRDIDKANLSANTPPTNRPPNEPPMKLLPSARNHFSGKTHLMEADGDKGGGSGGAAVIDPAKERADAIKDFRAKCGKIDGHVSSMKDCPPHWRAAAEELAKKHKDGEANFELFLAELQPRCTHTPPSGSGGSNITSFEVLPPAGRGSESHHAFTLGGFIVRSKDFTESVKRSKRAPWGVETGMSILGMRGKLALAQKAQQAIKQFEMRAGFTSSDLSSINLQVLPSLLELGTQRLTVSDLLAPGTTGAASIKYPQEQTLGTVNGVVQTDGKPFAGMVAERGLKPNWEPDLIVVTANAAKIAITTKVPDEFMADFPGFQSYIDGRLPFMVDTKAEEQMLYGDGLGDNLKGLMTFGGTLTRAYATSWAETLKKAITDVEVASFFAVDGIVMHPYDWEVASLEKDLEGRYIAGGPIYVQLSNGMYVEVRTYWGRPVVVTTACKVGQPIVGCFKTGAQYFIREGMRLESTNSSDDDFRRNLICIRAEERLILCDYRPTCFLEVTGGPART